jgi:large subunit ribosomal protein L11
MAQDEFDIIKLQIKGKANPAPPIGPALGQKGVNIQAFCTQYNDLVKDKDPTATFPVIIKVAKDKSFTITIKEQPTSKLILQATKLQKGAKSPGREVAGKISMQEVTKIAELKLKDMGLNDVAAAQHCVIGTARSMGIEVTE